MQIYRMAAERGSAPAMSAYGVRLIRGEYVDRDVAKGVLLVRRSARVGYPQGQFFMAEFHERGQGMPKDLVLSYAWARLAVKHGYEEATAFLDALRPRLTAEEIAEGERLAASWKAGTDLKR